MTRGILSPQVGLLLFGVFTGAAVACNEPGGSDDATGGEGSCVPQLYEVAELCESENFSGGYVDSSIPEDPLNNSSYVCSSSRPDLSASTVLFRYREGCGLAEWELKDPGPPWSTLVWEVDTEELIGCTYGEDIPLDDQCGDHSRHAGESFECDDFEEHYCTLAGMGGAGGAGPD